MRDGYRGQDELEWRRQGRRQRQKRQQKRRRKRRLAAAGGFMLLAAVVFACIWLSGSLLSGRFVKLSSIETPDWVQQQFFDVNPYSRPGTKLAYADGIVIHYVANPGTSGQQNWNYFNNLASQTGEKKISASSHFIIGPDGAILQGIPLDEMAYATSKEKNGRTISIECCHPDETGEFTGATYESLVKLTGWLCAELKLTEKDVIRHYDATGKDCPRYYVAHEEAWKDLLAEVKKQIKLQKEGNAD